MSQLQLAPNLEGEFEGYYEQSTAGTYRYIHTDDITIFKWSTAFRQINAN